MKSITIQGLKNIEYRLAIDYLVQSIIDPLISNQLSIYWIRWSILSIGDAAWFLENFISARDLWCPVILKLAIGNSGVDQWIEKDER